MKENGFSLLELLIVLSIVALLLGSTVPYGSRFFEGMQYRSAVRDTLTLLISARHAAIISGKPQDVIFDVEAKKVSLNDKSVMFPESVELSGKTAAELNRNNLGVIRFYPEGDSSGGEIDIIGRARGVQLSVDWLLGRVSQNSINAS